MKKVKINPLQITTFFLGLISLVALWQYPEIKPFIHLGATAGVSWLAWWGLSKFTKKNPNLWNTLITGFILFLVLHYEQIYYSLMATLIALGLKFFGEYKRHPVINPAVFGILAVIIIARLLGNIDVFASWWGVNLAGPWSFGLMILWILFGLRPWHKWPTVFTFLISNALFFWVLNQNFGLTEYEWIELKFIFTDATIYFFAAILLIDPKTSPKKLSAQITYAVTAALLYTSLLRLGFPYFELLTLAIVNLGYFLGKFWFSSQKKTSPAIKK
jgi:hypothetical protein